MSLNKLPLFKLFLLFVPFFSLGQAKTKIVNTEKFAGIDIGSKGVKLSILQIENPGQKLNKYTVIKDTSLNTDFISFTNSSFVQTANAIRSLYFFANKTNSVSTTNIFTVISSGVKALADRENKQSEIARLIDTFRTIIGDNNKKVDVINVTDEARLSHLGIVPESRRYTTFLIDIGSGNTKGGYFPNGNTEDLKLFDLSWGTKSVANESEKRLIEDKTFANYQKQVTRVLAGQANKDIVYAVNVSNAFMMNDYVAFSGGISWASATLLFPELQENSVVAVTYQDVQKLYDKIARNYASLNENAIAATITDKTINKTPVVKEIKRVHQVFDQKALLAGTGLLLGIMRQFDGVYEKKQFYLVKNGQVGWISAYVNQHIGNK